ncbi:MAG: putative hydrolase YxeP [Pseudomonadota bacterium]
MRQIIKNNIDRLAPEMIKVRHRIHSNPELAGEEVSTAKIITDVLRNFGYDSITTNIVGNGISVMLDSGKAGKTIGIRAELDALPILEVTNAPYKSKIDGKMHACGHDGHIATILTVAGTLIQSKEHFKGKIKFIFQPAEETAGSGAIDMVNNGVLENPTVDAIFGFHGTHRYEVNKVATNIGCLMASHDVFKIKLNGNGGYISSLAAKSNPIEIASLIIQCLKDIQNVTLYTEHIIVSVTKFDTVGTSGQVPNEVMLEGSIRTVTRSTQMLIKQQIMNAVMELATQFNVMATVDFKEKMPPVINTDKETMAVINAAKEVVEQADIINMNTIMAPEGFGSYLEKIPGCFFFMGNGLHRGSVHKGDYNFNDNVIPIAAEIMSIAVINYLNDQAV